MRSRLRKTINSKSTPFKTVDKQVERGKPESFGYTDNRSNVKSEVAYQLMMNDAIKKKEIGKGVIQRISYDSLGVLDKHDLRNYQGRNGWDEESIKALVSWSISLKQIRSVLGNMSAEEWLDLKRVHANGSELNTKVKGPLEELNPDKKRKGKERSKEELYKILNFWAKMANPTSANIDLKTLIHYQQTYEKLLLKLATLDHFNIMDNHRTMGVELEFAHYGGQNLGAHGILAISKNSVLSSVPGEWVLETDDSQKLEIGAPPMLIQDAQGGKLNVPVIKAIRAIVKAALQKARDQFKHDDKVEDFVTAMPGKGLGLTWTKTNKLTTTNLKFRGAYERSAKGIEMGLNRYQEQQDTLGLDYTVEDRDRYGVGAKKQSLDLIKAKKHMYEQINITLTPQEIAKNLERQKTHEGTPSRDRAWIYTLNDTIKAYLARFLQGSALSATRTIMAKGLAGIVVLSDAMNKSGFFSTIKEIMGIWIKDNTPNQVANSVPQAFTYRDMVLAFTNTVKPRKRKGKRKQANADFHATAIGGLIVSAAAMDPPDITLNATTIKKEVQSTLANINANVQHKTLIKNKDRSTYDQSESFTGVHAGLGVRKDTYINVKSGNKRKLHLAEVRSDWTIDRFMSDNE